MPENNGNQNPNESYTNKYQEHIAYNHGYKLVCIYDKFSKFLKSYLSEDTVHNFINGSMIKEVEYCNDVMKNHFNKEHVMAREDNEGF